MQKIYSCIFLFTILFLSCTRQSGPDYQLPPPPFLHLPSVSTGALSGITNNSASCTSEITDDGGMAVTARGICWSSGHNPTVALATKTMDGTGTGIFNSSITGLTTGVTYYVRAYATNGIGTAYGNEVGFVATTQPTLATLTTLNAVGITNSSALCGGDITREGNVPVTTRGVCWSTAVNPTITDNNLNIGSGPGIFSASITGLSSST
ncbi:MAG TPA: hypothetical protein PLZ45_14525, partial [Ferruginibacter sp.]|nr:hypothetical protein [Ferruginibacter sp.]